MSKQVEKGPPADETKEGLKVKKKVGRPRKLVETKDNIVKVDLSKTEKPKKEEDAISIKETREVPSMGETESTRTTESTPNDDVKSSNNESVPEKVEDQREQVLIEVTEKDTPTKEVIEKPSVSNPPPPPSKPEIVLPVNIEKLIGFMKDTGGTIQDYVRLNADYTNIDDSALLREYYKTTKPHLDSEEIDFILEDNFSWDDDIDDERHIKKKKLAYKEEIAKARNFLEDTKTKYYDEIKLRPSITQEQKKATEFFNRYNENQQKAEEQHKQFKLNTKNLFQQDFKGFDFNIGEKRFKYKVLNPERVAQEQSDISTFVKKFLNEDGSVNDYDGYHKAIYAANNMDTIANHFYEQGKTDAIRDLNAKSKNIENKPRQAGDEGDIFINGLKVRAISGTDSSKLKFKKIKK